MHAQFRGGEDTIKGTNAQQTTRATALPAFAAILYADAAVLPGVLALHHVKHKKTPQL